MDARKTDANGNPPLGADGNLITEQIMAVTDRNEFETTKELQRHRTRKKEDEQYKFNDDKELLLCFMLGQVDPMLNQILETLPEYEQIKKDQDLIGTLKCL